VGGNYATGLFADQWVVRLAPDDLSALLELPGAEGFSPMPGPSMAGWASLPPNIVGDDEALDGWIRRAMAHVESMPAKA
jgi:hypothetical protein